MATRSIQISFIGGEMAPVMFGRVNDVRFRHGVARMENFLAVPQGPAQKRPGLRFVRATKDSTKRSRLIPFAFSQDDSLVLELGSSVVDSRDIGYVRMHTNGATVLYQLPRAFVPQNTVTDIALATDLWTTGTAHGLLTGDPVVLTMHPTGRAVTSFTVANPGVVNHALGAFETNAQVIFEGQSGGTLPPELEERRIYYVRNSGAGTFEVAAEPGGTSIEFTEAGSGTRWFAAMPGLVAADEDQFWEIGRVYYVIEDTSTTFKLASTIENAEAGVALDIATHTGTGATNGDIRIHFDYQVGDLVGDSGSVFIVIRKPADVAHWLPTVTEDTHLGYPVSNTAFWMREPGGYSIVTFDLGDDEVDWTGHGLADGTTVSFTTTVALPSGLAVGTTYYVRNLSPPAANSFKLSTFPGGPTIDLGSGGSGTHTALAGAVFEVPHFFTEQEVQEIDYAQSLDVLTLTHVRRPAFELRRLGPTTWEGRDIAFNPLASPTGVAVTPNRGDGFEVGSSLTGTPGILNLMTGATTHGHGLTHGSTVYLEDIHADVPDGFYSISTATASVDQVALFTYQTHAGVTMTSATVGANAMLWPVTVVADLEQHYVVTALDDEGNESMRSAEVSVTNFLDNRNARNTITWAPVAGADRYNVYRKHLGVFAFIGQISADDALVFEDENIEPDASRTAPLVDDSLRQVARVTFDTALHRVLWPDHGLVDGDPVVFRSTGTLPTEITQYATYFVADVREDSFQVVEEIGGDNLSMAGVDTAELHEAAAGLFPASVGYFEQRRVFAGSLSKRNIVTMTRSGTESDTTFRVPTISNDRIQIGVSAREGNALRHVVPLSHLMVLSSSTEYRVTPVNDDALTPESVSVRSQGFVGSAAAQPAIVNNAVIFVASRGGHVREAGYGSDAAGIAPSYLSGDLSLRAIHLFDLLAISQIAYKKAPIPIVGFVSSSGLLLGLTYAPEEQIGAWYRMLSTDGTVESAAAVPEGMEDHLYVIVKRNVNGSDVRYIERLDAHDFGGVIADAFFVDAGVRYSGPATTSIFAPHLEGKTVVALADGIVRTGLTVSGGFATLPVAASKVQLGLPYTARIHTRSAILDIVAAGYGIPKAVNSAWIKVERSGAFQAGPLGGATSPSLLPASGALLDGTVDMNLPARWSNDGQIQIVQTDPLPLTIVSLTYEIETGG